MSVYIAQDIFWGHYWSVQLQKTASDGRRAPIRYDSCGTVFSQPKAIYDLQNKVNGIFWQWDDVDKNICGW
jgi:hypothetical protein